MIPESQDQIISPREKKEVSLKDLVDEYEDLRVKIDDLEAVIEQLAAVINLFI